MDYCQYRRKRYQRAKPTDIWTNINNPLDSNRDTVCKNGNKDCHHQPANKR